MDFSQDELDEILNIFSAESDEIVHRLNNNILALEKEPNDKNIIVQLFRDAHSLKGAARMIGFNDTQLIAHKIEDILGLAKENKIIISSDIIDVICRAIDFINLSIQFSVKEKKEVKLNDYGKYLNMLENIINSISSTQNTTVIELPKDNSTNDTKQNDFVEHLNKEIHNINAKIIEILYLFCKVGEEANLNFILALNYAIEWLYDTFKNSNHVELGKEFEDVLLKLEFVSKNTGILNKNELQEIENKIKNIINIIEQILKYLDIEVIDYYSFAKSKINSINFVAETVKDIPIPRFIAIELLENISKLEISLEVVDVLMLQVDDFIRIYTNTLIEPVFHKVKSILIAIKEQNVRPEAGVLEIFKQSINLIEKLVNDGAHPEKDDVELLLQSLDITQQMVSLKTKPSTDVQVQQFFKSKDSDSSTIEIAQKQNAFQFFDASAIKTLRVDTLKLDKLVNQIGEVIISKIKTQKHLLELETINNDLVELYDFAVKSQSYLKYYDRKINMSSNDIDISTFSNFNKQFLTFFSDIQSKLGEQIQKMYALHRNMQEDDTKLNMVVNKLEQMVKDIRLLPLATVFHMVPRMVRDIAKDNGKEIELAILGSETNADKKIIEEIKTPLIHIIRNAIDHGIETPEERIANGKKPVGKISLNAKHSENKIIIEVIDDGRGVNFEKIRQKAVSKGLLTPDEINSMTNDQIMNLIFWPGFTTEEQITDISGRGVGLDIVQTKIAQLNGRVKVKSFVGNGTKITIELPVTMATIKAFIIKLEAQSFAIPVSSIKSVMKVSIDDIFNKDGKNYILYQQKSIPIFNMAEVLGFEISEKESAKKTILLIETENTIAGFVVDELIGDQEILNKELAPPLFKLKNISGITTLINGDICLIVNVTEMIKSLLSNDYKKIKSVKLIEEKPILDKSERNILIVDDFMTTRTLLKNILVSNEYNVTVANDAMEAFGIIKHKKIDLIISDVEMPEINGYEFISQLKSNRNTMNIPTILITSIDNNVGKEKAKEVGANLFINKNDFNQEYFLKSIETLLTNGVLDTDDQ